MPVRLNSPTDKGILALDDLLKIEVGVRQGDMATADIQSRSEARAEAFKKHYPHSVNIGIQNFQNCISIEINHPDAKVIQLVNRYNIDEQQQYNQRIDYNRPYLLDNNTRKSSKEKPSLEGHLSPNKKEDYSKLPWKVDSDVQFCPYYEAKGAYTRAEDKLTIYDEPELMYVRTIDSNGHYHHHKDKVRFVTFIVDKDDKVLAEIEWSRTARPDIGKKWQEINNNDFNGFDSNNIQSYICTYKITSYHNYSNSPIDLPKWAANVIRKDATGNTFVLGYNTEQANDVSMEYSPGTSPSQLPSPIKRNLT